MLVRWKQRRLRTIRVHEHALQVHARAKRAEPHHLQHGEATDKATDLDEATSKTTAATIIHRLAPAHAPASRVCFEIILVVVLEQLVQFSRLSRVPPPRRRARHRSG